MSCMNDDRSSSWDLALSLTGRSMALLCQYQPGREVEAPQLGHISVGVLANGT